jgi:hypothetical protein
MVDRELTFNDSVCPVCLASHKDELPEECVVIGFGPITDDTVSSGFLQQGPSVKTYRYTSGEYVTPPLVDTKIKVYAM